MKIVLYQPQIPQNTGNIVRTCSVTGADLILIPPLGFSTQSRHLKRAGLDYWEEVQVSLATDFEEVVAFSHSFYFFSSHATTKYTDVTYSEDSILIFGSETSGLPKHIHDKYASHFVTLPMLPNRRCLNLATSVGIAIYEALRQQSFANLQKT